MGEVGGVNHTHINLPHIFSFSLSLIDSLDTLLVMGNVSEFQHAYHLVISKPSFNIDVNTSVFEANIRGIFALLLGALYKVPLYN